MKHIKRKFYFQKKKGEDNFEKSDLEWFDSVKDVKDDLLKKNKGNVAFLELDDDLLVGGIIDKIDGKHLILPIPDPTLVYFNNAQLSLTKIEQSRKTLLKELNGMKEGAKPPIHEIYDFYGVATGFIIYLFTSIESFLNSMIDDDYIYKDIQQKKTIHYNKRQIQENIDFKTKITTILPQKTGVNYFRKSTPSNQLIWKLKDFRDNIIHTKQEDHILRYKDLAKQSFTFKYRETLYAVAQFMNYNKNNYIVECDCGMDF